MTGWRTVGKLGVIILSLVLLASMILVAAPASALTQPQVTVTPSGALISAVSHYFIRYYFIRYI